MSDLFPFLIAGIVAGSLYGVTAMGLVLTYRTSGIFNFGHGAIAAGAAYLFYELRTLHGLPWPAAAFLCVFVAAPVLGAVLEVVARGLAAATPAAKIVGTVGIFLAIQGALTFHYGSSTITFEPFLPQRVFEIAGVRIGADQIIVTILGAVLAAGLSAFLRYTRLGIAMRGMVDDPALLDLTGASHTAIRLVSWVIGSCFAALSGLLIAPTIGLDPLLLTMLVVQAFGAAVIGRLSSLPLTYAGGLFVGVLAALVTKYVSGHTALGGLPASVPFLVLFGVLLTARRGRLSEAGTVRVGRVRRRPPALLTGGAVVFATAGLLAVPVLVGTRLSVYTNALIFVLVFLSLRLLVRSSGQVSLCHAAFAAIGAAAFSHLAHGLGLPWPLAVVGAGLAAVPVGAVVAIPAIRLSGLYLALATFGFGILVERLGFTTGLMFGKVGARVAPRPHGRLLGADLAGDRGFYYVVLGVVVLGILAVVAIDRTRLGRLLQGLAGSPIALTTQGATVNITRVLVFAVSAGLAGIAGALFGSLSGSINGTPFNSLQSLLWLAVLAIAGSGRFSAAFVAAGLLAVLPSYLTNPRWVELLPVAFGLAALASSVLQGGTPVVADWLRRSAARRREFDRPGPAGERWRATTGPHRRPGRGGDMMSTEGLVVTELNVTYGGHRAVDGLSLTAPPGRVTGLIGPNGAGKTSSFNAITGLIRPSGGAMSLDATDLLVLSPAARARHGLGRTFQRMELLEELTVAENIAIAREASLAGGRPWRHLVGRRHDRSTIRRDVEESLAVCSVTDLAARQVASLSTGQRRLVELARVVAGGFRILLLDEPSSGLDASETQRFGTILEELVARRGVGILLVEHDMSLVMRISSYIHVIDFGKPIFEGTPSAVMASDIVRAAYLGSEAVEVA